MIISHLEYIEISTEANGLQGGSLFFIMTPPLALPLQLLGRASPCQNEVSYGNDGKYEWKQTCENEYAYKHTYEYTLPQ